MKQKIQIIVLILTVGFILTCVSVVRLRTTDFKPCRDSGYDLHEVRRGFPLSYLVFKPSVSLCETIEPFSKIGDDNFYHAIDIGNMLVNFAFWTAVTSAVGGIIVGIRQLHHASRRL